MERLLEYRSLSARTSRGPGRMPNPSDPCPSCLATGALSPRPQAPLGRFGAAAMTMCSAGTATHSADNSKKPTFSARLRRPCLASIEAPGKCSAQRARLCHGGNSSAAVCHGQSTPRAQQRTPRIWPLGMRSEEPSVDTNGSSQGALDLRFDFGVGPSPAARRRQALVAPRVNEAGGRRPLTLGTKGAAETWPTT